MPAFFMNFLVKYLIVIALFLYKKYCFNGKIYEVRNTFLYT